MRFYLCEECTDYACDGLPGDTCATCGFEFPDPCVVCTSCPVDYRPECWHRYDSFDSMEIAITNYDPFQTADTFSFDQLGPHLTWQVRASIDCVLFALRNNFTTLNFR